MGCRGVVVELVVHMYVIEQVARTSFSVSVSENEYFHFFASKTYFHIFEIHHAFYITHPFIYHQWFLQLSSAKLAYRGKHNLCLFAMQPDISR